MIVAAIAVAVVFLLLLAQARRRAAKASVAALDAGLAATIDLIVVVLGSGGTVHDGIATVAALGPEAVRQPFAMALRRSAGGMLLSDALEMASADLTASFHPLIGALVSAERIGGPVSLLLQRLADDADQARRWQLEGLTKRLSVSLIVPLVLCSLPAVVVGALIPLVIVALRQLAL